MSRSAGPRSWCWSMQRRAIQMPACDGTVVGHYPVSEALAAMLTSMVPGRSWRCPASRLGDAMTKCVLTQVNWRGSVGTSMGTKKTGALPADVVSS